METVKCSECSMEILKSKLISIDRDPIKDEDVVCCRCLRKHYGEQVYLFLKGLRSLKSDCQHCENNHEESV